MLVIESAREGAEHLAQMFSECEKPLFFTGAGISTESGIPDFRGPSGFWKTNTPIQFQDFLASEQVRLQSWQRHFAVRETMLQAQPNSGHLAIARMMEIYPEASLITQNVDNLHQDAGSESRRVVELHGNATYAKCLSCHVRHETESIRQQIEEIGSAPLCSKCGGIVKTATISFGQSMPQAEVLRSMALAKSCDLFLSMGSSLLVQPASEMPVIASENGSRLAIINLEQTPADAMADVAIRAPLGELLTSLLQKLDNQKK